MTSDTAWEAEVDDLVQSIAEWDDRTSPDDYPGHLLITPDELKEFARDVAALPTPPKVGSGELDAAGLAKLIESARGKAAVFADTNPTFAEIERELRAASALLGPKSFINDTVVFAAPVDHPEVVGNAHHEFVADPYRPSHCVNCGSSHAARIHDVLQPSDSPALAGIANDAGSDGWRPIVQRPTDRRESWFKLADGSTFWGRWNRDHWERRADALTMTAATEARGGVEREGVDYPLNIFERLPDGIYPVAWRSDSPALEAAVVVTDAMVEQAMCEEWDEICSDTGCHPLDIDRQGRKLFFHPSHWAAAVAKNLRAALSIPAKEDGK